jgi:hypothetical protein
MDLHSKIIAPENLANGELNKSNLVGISYPLAVIGLSITAGACIALFAPLLFASSSRMSAGSFTPETQRKSARSSWQTSVASTLFGLIADALRTKSTPEMSNNKFQQNSSDEMRAECEGMVRH